MKIQLVAGLAALATLAAVPALAQAPATTTTTTTTTAAAGPMSVEKTTIGALWANPTSKAVLEKNVPGIEQYMDQIKDMTLAQVAPMSQGAIDDAKLKAIQADLDKAGK
jgi:TolA-binding protein